MLEDKKIVELNDEDLQKVSGSLNNRVGMKNKHKSWI